MLSWKRSCTQCECDFLRPPGTGSFQSWRQAPFVSRAGLRQQEWEEEQALNKNIVSAAFAQSATMCAGSYREQDNLCLMPGVKRERKGSGTSWDDRRTQKQKGGRVCILEQKVRCIFSNRSTDRREIPKFFQTFIKSKMRQSYSVSHKAVKIQICVDLFHKKQFSELYESTPWSSFHLRSRITAFRWDVPKRSKMCHSEPCLLTIGNSLFDSEGSDGLRVFYWSKFSAPGNFAAEIQRSGPDRQQRRLPGTNKVQRYSRNEQQYLMEDDDDVLSLLGKSTSCWCKAEQMNTVGQKSI